MLQDIVLTLLREAMLEKASTAKGFLIDGYPRELEQGIRFEKEVGSISHEIVKHVHVWDLCWLQSWWLDTHYSWGDTTCVCAKGLNWSTQLSPLMRMALFVSLTNYSRGTGYLDLPFLDMLGLDKTCQDYMRILCTFILCSCSCVNVLLWCFQIKPCEVVLVFDVPDDVMTQRLMERGKNSGRVDDNEETIKKRLETFHNITQPVIDHFQENNKVRKVCVVLFWCFLN